MFQMMGYMLNTSGPTLLKQIRSCWMSLKILHKSRELVSLYIQYNIHIFVALEYIADQSQHSLSCSSPDRS